MTQSTRDELHSWIISLGKYALGPNVTAQYKVQFPQGDIKFPLGVSGWFIFNGRRVEFNILIVFDPLNVEQDSEFDYGQSQKMKVFCASVTNVWMRSYVPNPKSPSGWSGRRFT